MHATVFQEPAGVCGKDEDRISFPLDALTMLVESGDRKGIWLVRKVRLTNPKDFLSGGRNLRGNQLYQPHLENGRQNR